MKKNKEIESYVCSFEQAKKLKDLGVEQDSLFWWTHNKKLISWKIMNRKPEPIDRYDFCSAFTSQELEGLIMNNTTWREEETFVQGLIKFKLFDVNKSLTLNLAELLIYLLENEK